MVSRRPWRKEYPYEHAFGSTVDAGTFGSDTPPIGEILPTFRQVSPMLPSLYDGSEEPFFMPQLLFGANAAVMAAGCFDGCVEIEGSATIGFAPTVIAGGSACECSIGGGGNSVH